MKVEESLYCKRCEACGEEGCCSPLDCAYDSMVKNNEGCMYGDRYYKDIEFAYKMYEALYEKYPDEEIFDNIFKTVYDNK